MNKEFQHIMVSHHKVTGPGSIILFCFLSIGIASLDHNSLLFYLSLIICFPVLCVLALVAIITNESDSNGL